MLNAYEIAAAVEARDRRTLDMQCAQEELELALEERCNEVAAALVGDPEALIDWLNERMMTPLCDVQLFNPERMKYEPLDLLLVRVAVGAAKGDKPSTGWIVSALERWVANTDELRRQVEDEVSSPSDEGYDERVEFMEYDYDDCF